MKFAEHLSAHITPEWRKQYICYDKLKDFLNAEVRKIQNGDGFDDRFVSRQIIQCDEHFFQFCDQQLNKINTFFSEKLAEAMRKYATLTSDVKTVLNPTSSKRLREAKLAFSEFYLNLVLLQNYEQLNSTGFRKICKKHDKLLGLDTGTKWFKEHIETAKFVIKQSEIDNLIKNVESFVTGELENGNRSRAMKRLRVPPLGEHQLPWTTFKVGLFSGAFIVLVFVLVISLSSHQFSNYPSIIQLFRAPFFFILFLFLISLNLYGWRSAGVNHVLIFELDPRNHLSAQNLMELSSIWAVVWALTFLNFFYSNVFRISTLANPYILSFLMLIFFVNPTKTCYSQSRRWLMNICYRIFLAPLFHVNFADFWLADQFCSLTVLFLDIHYFSWLFFFNFQENFYKNPAFLISHQIVGCLPAWFRFAQCVRRFYGSGDAFPHLANALKYATTFIVSISYYLYKTNDGGLYLYLWLLCLIINTTYCIVWDLKMDWGLFDMSEKTEYRFLREEIVYPANLYYFAIVEDILLRFSWLLKVGNELTNRINDVYLKSLIYLLEILRRCIWNFFRLENEHLNNCGQFRAVRDISIVPVNLDNDEDKIIKMMDEPDGVRNRRNCKNWPVQDESFIRLPLI